MLDFDRQTWLYLAIIAIAFLFFRWNSRRAKQNRNDRKNRNFRRRYEERKRENKKAREDLDEKSSGK
ncbi:hypothetical protein RM553_16310 [Zunongwangia sp. F363]|uniref:Uncharacterized protein n=1 Tax=Autumnicola tepida TaxID=3075595 RepID=A0ABU3CDI8_9FLAO|nr:hypothetical protein [Zunongwangia sp. F363]MDT0644403.1 hypothetical protein [Zunongwangia sp. F363]